MGRSGALRPVFAASLAVVAVAASWVAPPSPPVLAELFRRARGRLFGGDVTATGAIGGPCASEDAASSGRLNFFLSFPLHASQFGHLAYAALEAVLFHHPSANVIVVSFGLPQDFFDAYLREGYCVVSSTLDVGQVETLFAAATSPDLARIVSQAVQGTFDEASLIFLMNCMLLALQVVYGGVSLQMDGVLLNPFDYMLPRQLSLTETAIFSERLLPPEAPPQDGALQAEDSEKSWLPRGHTDRADGRTVLSLDLASPRALPAGSNIGRIILEAWLAGAVEGHHPTGAFAAPADLDALATALYRLYVQQRPARAPINVEGFEFNHECVLLPYWVVAEPHFSDGWKHFGGRNEGLSVHSQLYAPRPQREPVDWTLISTAKMWLPLGYGPPSSRNILPRSVADMALRHMTLGIAPRPYKQKGFGGIGEDATARRLRSPRDAAADFAVEEVAAKRNEGSLPGDIGGFRTFGRVRLIGRDKQRSAVGWRLTVSTKAFAPRLHCRREHRPTPSSQTAASAAFRHCEAALGQAAAASSSSASDDGWSIQFDACGSPADLNAAVTLLAYTPVAGLSHTPPPAPMEDTGSLDVRLSGEELSGHFGELKVAAFQHCSAPQASHSFGLSMLVDDVEEHVTVVAHSAERCHLLDRLAASFREVYTQLPIVVTCECSEEELCLEPRPSAHANIPGMTVVSVPYDFGLSRGKTLLARMADTEFILVLDDDFTHSFHSCLECMLWRMRNMHHSLWRPFDIVGFPVVEDERIFGAFRGQLRVTNRQLFLEPLVEQTTSDGCMRVDICPMVFLARTTRLRRFKFQEELTVGEHEKFFFSNAYLGMQVAVCFDSSFPHFRVNTMSAGYVKRRERMPDLMLSAFKNLGFERAMFLFRKYDHGSMEDYDELLDKTVPPWYISDDACGPRPSPPVPFAQIFAVVLSTNDADGRRYRHVLRGQTGAASWLLRFAGADASNMRWVFVVASDEEAAGDMLREQDRYKDIIVVPRNRRPGSSLVDATLEQLLRTFSLLRDFQFRWMVVAQQDVFVNADRLAASLQAHDPPQGKVLGAWHDTVSAPLTGSSELPGAVGQAAVAAVGVVAAWLDARFFALSRDVFSLFSSPQLSSLLQVSGHDASFGDLGSLGGGLNAWLRAFAVDRVPLKGVRLGEPPPLSPVFAGAYEPSRPCPPGTLALHPVTPEQMYSLSATASC